MLLMSNDFVGVAYEMPPANAMRGLSVLRDKLWVLIGSRDREDLGISNG